MLVHKVEKKSKEGERSQMLSFLHLESVMATIRALVIILKEKLKFAVIQKCHDRKDVIDMICVNTCVTQLVSFTLQKSCGTRKHPVSVGDH